MRARAPQACTVAAELPRVDVAELDDEAAVEAVELVGSAAVSGHLAIEDGRLRASLAGAALSDLHLKHSEIVGADLANLGARSSALHRVWISEARCTGASLPGASLRDVTFTGCMLDLVDLSGARMERVVFADCTLREASFAAARMRDVRFERCDLARADLAQASLERVELVSCDLTDVRSIRDLRGAAMPYPDILAAAGLLAATLGIAVIEDD